MAEKSSGFWSSLQGIITALAALITAITGLYIAIWGGSDNHSEVKEPTVKTEVIVEVPKVEAPKVKVPKVVAANNTPDETRSPRQTKDSIEVKPKEVNAAAAPKASALVDCASFPTVNTVRSLMSWSNYYHQKIIDAAGVKQQSANACSKTINYRAQAHCKVPLDQEVRQALFETLSLCKAAGIEWSDVVQR